MRILLVAPMLPQADGAGAIPLLLHTQLGALRERHAVTLVAGLGDEPGEAGALAALRADGVDLHVADRRRPAPGPARRRRQRQLAGTWLRRGWPWRTVWFAAPAAQEVLDRLGATRTFDVVVVEDSAMGVLTLPRGVPAVLTEHEVRRPRPPARPAGPVRDLPRAVLHEADWRRWRTFQPAVWRRFDRIQVFGPRDADAIAALAPDVAARVRVNPFGLTLPPAPDPAREDPDLVLFVGNFTHPPNRDAARWLARDIMPLVRELRPRARLRIVGTAPPADVLGLAGPHVEVVPDAPDVTPHLAAAAVVLAPIRTGGGMRMKVLHALAAGRPVVTTPRGAEGFTPQGGELPLLVAEDAAGLAAATAALLGDPARRRALGAAGRAHAIAQHGPAAWAARLEAVYAEARDLPQEARADV